MTSATRRRLYAGRRPGRVARVLNRGQAALHSVGIWPKRLATLEVVGRRSGRRISLPVVIADHEGERYLVAMLGENASWVANVRAAGGHVALRHGKREALRLEEVAPADRAPILRRYLDVAAGARAHFPLDRHAPLEDFEAIASQYPVFRVRPDWDSRAGRSDPALTKPATIYFDGGGQSPGPVTAACIVELSDGSSNQAVERFDHGTHNIAEWQALILGLRIALEHGERHVVVKGDSMLVVRQINREWQTKNEALRSLRAEAEELLERFETWRVEWIPRKENRRADALGRSR